MTKTNFSPNTSRYIDIEDVRNALFAYLIAKQDAGEFLLRIEDINQSEYTKSAEEFLYHVLDTFRLVYDEGPNKESDNGPYNQSKRLDIYKKYAQKLIKKGYAYYCFCDEVTLNKKRLEATDKKENFKYDGTCRNFPKDEAQRRVMAGETYVIREKMPDVGQTSYRDLVYGDITVENNTLEDQILIKSNGMPTYNFANVIDDALMGITHVTKECTFLTSTPKYLLLYDALEFQRPEFMHFPLIITKNDKKRKKGKKGNNLMDLLNQGFMPEAILNYLAFLGWSPKDAREFFTLEELVENFDSKRIHRRPAHYDIKKLEWFNHHYIKEMNKEDYLKFVRPFLEEAYNLEGKKEDWIRKLLLLYKNTLSFGAEIVLFTYMFFQNTIEFEEKAISFLKSDVYTKKIILVFREEIKRLDIWTEETIKEVIKKVGVKSNVTGKMLYMPIRIAVSGVMHGPRLETIIELLGKDTVLQRLGE